ncbi:hypothetical protein LCGC14_3103670, partial [marine sediment metagenome]
HALINIGVVYIDQFDDNEKFDVPVGSGIQVSEDIDEYFFYSSKYNKPFWMEDKKKWPYRTTIKMM